MPTRRLASWRRAACWLGAAGAEAVVVRAGTRRGSQHAESLLMERIGELTVAHMPGEHGLLLAGRAGSRLVPA